MARPKLKVGDITIEEVLILSEHLYKKGTIDNKKDRAKIDVTDAKITAKKNLIKKEGKWIQSGREIKFEFIVRTDPKSYKKTDTVKIHRFPVTFVLREYHKGFQSAFKWRTGSLKKPLFPTKKISEAKTVNAKNRIRKENLEIQNQNIRNGIQLQFFFNLEFILEKWGLLYGINWAEWSPNITNPDYIPFFDKHSYFCVTEILPKILNDYKPELYKIYTK